MTNAYTLTIALGGKWASGSGTACCPAHDDHTPSLSIADGMNGQLLLYCHAGCDYAEIKGALRGRGLIDGGGAFRPIGAILRAERLAKKVAEAERRSRLACKLWKEALPITGTPAEHYMRSRGIFCELPSCMRYKESCWHSTATRLPALVSWIHVKEGAGCAVHRTYLKEDGSGKADVTPAKAMLGPASGGAVHLSNDPGPLVVAEGLETALSLRCGILPGPATIWAALSASGMAALRLPERRGRLIVAPDGDPVGRKAAEALATRAHGLGWQVSLLIPPEGFDWNDVLMGKAVAA
ncbi:MAG: hypothetical protein GC146_12180 [Limimaricola sp.]|uniref:DUF7146 domain-containing protein n=1 Tax=Limimaricola sp. TaxID=2211665 RepID=UPI001D8FB6AA|nr:toprim domain-containing protein [Limimaricola sp.]MBI1417972.1 hypothetical protein [Limimaricola sp.]